MDQYIGKMLDNRYEILEVIGTGGMAVVYKARCHRLNRLVAIKVLRDELARDEEFRRRFHDEPQAVAMLSHPNIMAIYDVSKSAELDYIVMELIDGITLKQYMQKRGMSLNWRESLHFITQIMKALSHAHDRGIIHRDIKPQNIMVLRDGSVKVTDFGIARLVSDNQNTLTQEALGSVHYISPEQARGSRIDNRADIYSAGVVLYEMLTGRLPFEGDTPVSVAIQHIHSIPLSPRELNPELPEALEAITMKAMTPDVEKRYVDADAMLADLEEFRKNPSIHFDYTAADLAVANTAGDEPTQVIEKPQQHTPQTTTTAEPKVVQVKVKRTEEEEVQPVAKKRKKQSASLSIPLAIFAILIFVAGIGMFLWMSFFSTMFAPAESGKEVPELVGKIYDEVVANPTYTMEFNIQQGEVITNASIPAGTILKQTPTDGTMVKGDRPTIIVDISGGVQMVSMPDVKNLEYREAMAALGKAGITHIETVQEISETVTVNYIIRTEPEALVEISSADTVTLIISQGPEVKPVTMLSLLDKTLEEATQILTETLHLNLGTVTEVDSDKPAGTVVQQSVAAGTELNEGSTVALQVSRGPAEPSAEPTDDPNAPPSGIPLVSDDPGDSTQPPISSENPDVTPPPTGSVAPSPEPTPSAVPLPSTTPTVSKTTSISYTVTIPQDGGDTVRVKILVGDSVQFENPVQTTVKSISPFISGSGTQTVSVYFDDVLAKSEQVTFS